MVVQVLVKIIDLMPVNKETIELIVSKGSQVSEEDITKVLEITKKYAKK